MSRLARTTLTLSPLFLFLAFSLAADHPVSVTADEALARLQAGNERFAKHAESAAKPTAERRAATVTSQNPIAIIVGCADSRTAPEIIFDQNIGELFVVRTAGNLVDGYALGSIEYAVEHLGTRLVVVLSHQRCGAVQAAISSDSAPGHVDKIVQAIRPAVESSRSKPGDLLINSTEENASRVASMISQDTILRNLGDVRVVEGFYSLDTGRVSWIKK